ncbi:NUDIX hydrolase [Paenibacillus sp. R14(2021)]|uniref:NUDIX hydrolase n=1 Tax=Paenibacillus sp. R14(2021) TaxID=2859228 RepID=UPI0021574A75|nr:NUDIX domain-containing protein [Paenibacillus sp. R14(2021)]
MVYHDHQDCGFWTLPGGGVEEGETLEEAVIREVKEEVNLYGKVQRLLFEDEYEYGPVYCFLVNVNGSQDALLGYDPELSTDKQIMKRLSWIDLQQMKEDIQVSKVISSLA